MKEKEAIRMKIQNVDQYIYKTRKAEQEKPAWGLLAKMEA